MRILMLNSEFPPLGGGAGNATYYLLKEFSKYRNLEIDLITSSICHFRQKKFSDNIQIYFLNIGKKNNNLHEQSYADLIRFSWQAFWLAKKLTKKKRYHLIHSFFTVPSGFIAMLLRIPYIVSIRGSDVPFYSKKYRFLDKWFFQWINPFVWEKACAVIANSSDLRDLAHNCRLKKDIGIIPNGVDTDEFKPRNKQRIFSKNITIISTSRFTERKGILLLLKAFEGVSKNKKNLNLLLVGKGEQETKLKSYAKEKNILDKVIFRGMIPHDRIAYEYNNADIFILPSFNEGMSNSLLEALASGLAVVATNTGGSRELVENNNGFLISKGSVTAIENAIKKIIQNPEKLHQMKSISRQKAEKIGWEKSAKDYFEVFKNILYKKNIYSDE